MTSMYTCLISLILLSSGSSDFLVGRLREGQFEYPRLNGWMPPGRARRRCDRDPKCGGFTYKGFISLDSSQEFNVFFFHLVFNFEDGPESWHWVSYKAEKEFILFENMTDHLAEAISSSKTYSPSSARNKCLRMRSKCAGIFEEEGDVRILGNINLDRLQLTNTGHTLVKLELPYSGAGDGVTGSDSYQGMNLCCPRTNLTKDRWEKVVRDAKISDVSNPVKCTVDPEEFRRQFVLKTSVAKITNCEKEWRAAGWTIEGLSGRAQGSWLWKTNFVDNSGIVQNTNEQGQLRPGSESLEMMKNNLTVRLFDPIARHETEMNRRQEKLMTGRNKLELREDYSIPAILGRDLFDACEILTDYQWMLISGPNTGTSVHVDPPFANSWNTVLQGHKLWAIMPPDTEQKMFDCDPECSENGFELSPISWFLHVLPQLRGRKFYGQEIMEVLQGPGDTLYIPTHAPHAVLNYDWSLGVTENIMTEEMLLELPHKLLMGGGLLPETEAWLGERREERIWKCLTRGRHLSGWARNRLKGAATQTERMLKKHEGVCRKHQYGRLWLGHFGMQH